MRILAPLCLSLSVAFGVAPPGLAQNYDLQGQTLQNNGAAAAIAALLALGVIAAIADDDDDDDDDREERRRDHDEWTGWDDRDWDEGRRDGRVLSADCVRHVHGGQRVLAGECLRRHGHRARLPDHCLSWIRAGGRDRPVYDMRCLRGSGYHVR